MKTAVKSQRWSLLSEPEFAGLPFLATTCTGASLSCWGIWVLSLVRSQRLSLTLYFLRPLGTGAQTCDPDLPTRHTHRDLAWGLVRWRSGVSAELPAVSRSSKGGGSAVGPGAQGGIWSRGEDCREIVAAVLDVWPPLLLLQASWRFCEVTISSSRSCCEE